MSGPAGCCACSRIGRETLSLGVGAFHRERGSGPWSPHSEVPDQWLDVLPERTGQVGMMFGAVDQAGGHGWLVHARSVTGLVSSDVAGGEHARWGPRYSLGFAGGQDGLAGGVRPPVRVARPDPGAVVRQ